ncbi:MAG: chemotaxis protein CheW [Terriglobales bacterium]
MDETPQLDQQMTEQSAAEKAAVLIAEEHLPERQYCVFRSGRERFCLPVLDIEEVVDWPSVTRVPLAPAFLMGIFNLRGAIVPVVDIAFTSARRADLSPKRVVVARLAGEDGREDLRLGIAADEVIGTYTTTEPLLIEEAPRDVPHCCGMLRHPGTPGAGVQESGERQDDRLALALDLKRLVEAFPVPVI